MMMRVKQKVLTIVGLLAVTAYGYQFDNVQEPSYPVLLPTPRNISFGSQATFIDPCFFTVTSNVTVKDGENLKVDPKVITANIQEYINTKVFYRASDCGTSIKQNRVEGTLFASSLNVQILQQTSDLIPIDLEDGDESYNLIIDGNSTNEISLVANQYLGAMRGLATIAQLVKYS